ncbi:DEAD/DEAH box helicase [Belnapia rosea]|uniref:Helicase conserved C-terminal domain-containing protein n=1 Tax=Belnapia rosea TaxID=938405 RepID=A0A1G6VSA0_9PROT|nr:DEAD/DEAH box helicase [Belnapia rosea]SDD56424.1 Helicase conserved C-terminal domain-containing protein [Belnapia rosea]
MTPRFEHAISDAGTELRLVGPKGAIPLDQWAIEAPPSLISGVDLVHRFIAAESALADDEMVLLEHETVAGLSLREAGPLNLGPVAEVRAVVQGRGLLTRPDFSADLQWQRPNGQAVLNADRVGAWLKLGDSYRRLPAALLAIAEQVDRLNAVPADDTGARLAAIAALREVLPAASAEAEAKGILGQLTIAQADAFSLDLEGEGESARLLPVLHQSGENAANPVLTPAQQRAFAADQFYRFGAARPVYTLGNGVVVVLAPQLRRALEVVRKVASQPLARRKALLAAPRAWLREAIGEDADGTVLESVFRETEAWSDRVLGLGLWQPRILPWIALQGADWFGPETTSESSRASAPQTGLVVDGQTIPLTPEENRALQARVEDAIGAGRGAVPLEAGGKSLSVPATHETLAALQKAEAAGMRPQAKAKDPAEAPEVLLIKPNEESVDVEAEVAQRPSPPRGSPTCLATNLKPHQAEGLEWLQRAWSGGEPGVLLADDMGLGKTLQGLAFLAWLREGMSAGVIPKVPLLIVAPTGLLENWRAEHDRHLAAPGLGRCLNAFGKGLAALRRAADGTGPGLDVAALGAADWVLTTYETLRDYDRDFGGVRFAALLFDEAQKIKTPGIRLTDAAKAMNADFRVALTGTPVENRLADLWCIVDGVHPGGLGDLKSFSAEYERSPDEERLRRLKRLLDSGSPNRPALMLRRLKEDRLPDLPPRHEVLREAPMPKGQAEAYAATVAAARGADRAGAVLEALQQLRALCLHPSPDDTAEDAAFIAASARLLTTFRSLDEIAQRGERALVFLDHLALQARLVGIIQRRYGMALPPMVINGEVTGAIRQARVDRFQAGGEGFDVMLLSPRAGGVGLTLTRANHVIHLARWWNPAVEDQCTGRVLRIGQTRPVTVHLPLATLPDGRRSFDQNLHALLTRKRQLMRDALLPPGPTGADQDELFTATMNG